MSFKMNVFWHAIPILIKPDALSGEKNCCTGSFAASYVDFIIYEFERMGYASNGAFPNVDLSKKVRKHVKKMLIANRINRSHFVLTEDEIERFKTLKLKWNDSERVSATEIIIASCEALGFHIVSSKMRTVSLNDCKQFYYDYLENPIFYKKLENYVVNGQSIILLLCGKRDVWFLQLIKIYIRFYFLWQNSRKTYKNWLHVMDHDAPNYPQLIEMFIEN